MYKMSVIYKSIFPLSQHSTYNGDENVDFVLSFEGQKLVPGSLYLEGKIQILNDAGTTMTNADDIKYDPYTGYHGLFRDITTEFQTQGTVESVVGYPRMCKMQTVATNYEESMASESQLAVEGVCPNDIIAHGYCLGEVGGFQSFSVKPKICLNRASGPISAKVSAQVKIRVRLAPNIEFLYGTDCTSNTSYVITDLALRYQTIPDDGKATPVTMNVTHTFRTQLDSNNQNISTYVPGPVDNFTASFIPQVSEGSYQLNYLQMAAPPGQPPLGADPTATTAQGYGVERLYIAVNDTDSALVSFTLESREEIVVNGLRAYQSPAQKYSALIRHFRAQSSDCYLIGLPFGGLLDFSQTKFAVEIQSQCTSQNNETGTHIAYFYFRGLTQF